MAGESTNSIEALVLSDAQGNLYAIPRETLDRYRLTEEQKAAVAKELGNDDVAGFFMSSESSASSASTLSGSAQSSQEYSNQQASASSAPLLTGTLFNLSASLFNPDNEIT